MIGIIVADSNELSKMPLKIKETKKVNQFEFVIFEEGVVMVHSGIGIANAAAATQSLLDNFNIDTLYNYGAVGGNKHVSYKDVITPKKIYYHDVITPWYKRGQTPGESEYYENAAKSDKSNNLASGSSFITDKEAIKEIKKELDCDIFDMETAAIAQIAQKNKTPLKVFKGVSDSIGHTSDELENINERISVAGKLALNAMLIDIKN